MNALKAHVENGRIIVDEPTDLPEGTVLHLVPMNDGGEVGAVERTAEGALRYIKNIAATLPVSADESVSWMLSWPSALQALPIVPSVGARVTLADTASTCTQGLSQAARG